MSQISCNKFTDFLVNQTPLFARPILEDVRPQDPLLGYFSTGTWDAYDGVTKTQHRFNSVFPKLTAKWNTATQGTCVGTPCDPEEVRIGYGNTQTEYSREKQSAATDLFCFDEMLSVTQAREHVSYIISNILRRSTSLITSNFLRKRMADRAGKKWLANATMSDFTFSWENTGNEDIYITTNGTPTSLLTPQMLQRRVQPLINLGYLGKTIGKSPMVLELQTDLDTLWEMNKNATMADATNLLTHWRFMEFDSQALKDYWSYGWSGQIGNYMVTTDFWPLRFNRVSANRFQVVYPYENEAATAGIRDNTNDDYDNALYQFSFIRHRMALQILTFNASPVSPEMQFLVRDYAGRWRFVMDNLGADRNGCVIENKRRNKGQFIADFDLSVKPLNVEWLELIFHLRQPACLTVVPICGSDPGYPAQNYDAENDPCPDTATLYFTPDADATGHYVIAADTIACNGVPQNHAAIDVTTLTNLVTQLTAVLDPDLGTWAEVGDSVRISLADSTCSSVTLPFVT